MAIHTVLFISRKKDNQHVENFKERTESFLTSMTISELKERFYCFSKRGLASEICRFYISVNARNEVKIRKALLHELIDDPNIKLQMIESKVTSIANKSENKDTRYFLLDCDCNAETLEQIEGYLLCNAVKVHEVFGTYNNFGIITDGFDTRELLEKFPDVTLDRDGMRFVEAASLGLSPSEVVNNG